MLEDVCLLRLVVQRASRSEVFIGGVSQGPLSASLIVFFGVGLQENLKNSFSENLKNSVKSPVEFHGLDSFQEVAQTPEKSAESLKPLLEKLADKLFGLRVFSDSAGKMNLSLASLPLAGGAPNGLYVVSQFTLFADCSKGFRPGFSRAAPAPFAQAVYAQFVKICSAMAPEGTALRTGQFGADMQVSLVNDGPVTLILEATLKGGLR